MFKFLSSDVSIKKNFFRIPRISGLLVGNWPRKKRSFFVTILFLINTFAVAVGGFGENLYGLFFSGGDLVSALEAFCPGVTKMISLLKMCSFFLHNDAWYQIIQRMRALLFSEENHKNLKMVDQYAKTANIFAFIALVSGCATNAFFNLRPLWIAAFNMAEQEQFETILPFNIILPEVFRNYPLYPLTYCILALSGAMTVFSFSFVDGFFICSCAYMCGLFRMLQYDIRQIFAILKPHEFATLEQNLRIRKELTVIVQRHNTLIDLCSDFTAKFSLIILMHFLSAALVVCLSILEMILNSGSLAVFIYIFYSIADTTQLFLYCLGGSYISESSSGIADTLYTVEWYKCDVKTRKMILMILRRSQKAKTIAVPFFTPSLPAFASIISTAGSYLALLKTFL